ncbi:hypothetical protein [Metabacillus litoralis]|nr:hypothetical protein [Metabacillus litoralis]MCM3409505.1 hypothetical protein [Metabacillus litoralis]
MTGVLVFIEVMKTIGGILIGVLVIIEVMKTIGGDFDWSVGLHQGNEDH